MPDTESGLSRRELLRAGAAGLAAALGAAAGPAFAQRRRKEMGAYGPFRMGVQSYSLRAFPLDEALDMTEKLALHYWEATPDHVPLTTSPADIKALLAKFRAADIRLAAWGVTPFGADEAEAARVFEFARLAKIETISADPAPEALPILDRLVAKHKVNIAIHNHGPGSRYSKIADVAKAIEGHHPRIGACIDTGHFLRSGEDPVEAARVFGKRTYLVHLKDVKDKTTFTEVGRGDLRTVDLFRVLRKVGFRGVVALEYEEHPEAPGPYMDISLAATRDAAEKAVNMP